MTLVTSAQSYTNFCLFTLTGVVAMINFRDRSKKQFNATMFDRVEAYWVLPDGKSFVRSDEDQRAIEIFETLLATVDANPSSLIEGAEELRVAGPATEQELLALLKSCRDDGCKYGPSITRSATFATRAAS
jgi:hypothetical protein